MSDRRQHSVQLPHGLKSLLRGLTREILKHNPQNFEKYALEYFEKKLRERDNGLPPSSSSLPSKNQDKINHIASSHHNHNFDEDVGEEFEIDEVEENEVFAAEVVYNPNDDDDDDDGDNPQSNSGDIQNAADKYLRSLCAYLAQKCNDRSKKSMSERISTTQTGMSAQLITEYLSKEFQPFFVAGAGDGKTKGAKGSSSKAVNFPDFCKVLSKVKVPGVTTVPKPVFQYIAKSCEASSNNAVTVDITKFITLLLGHSTNIDSSGKNPAVASTKAKFETFSLGFVKGNSISPASNITEQEKQKSAEMPPYDATREHIYGMNLSDIYTNNSIHSLPLAPSNGSSDNLPGCTLVYSAGCVGVVHDLVSNTQRYYEGHYDDIVSIALSPDGRFAATGCVRSTGSEKDKKTATVKTAFTAVIHIWSTTSDTESASGIKSYIMSVGNGFFDKSQAVSSVTFSKDMSYICGIGADDNHKMGIWALSGLNGGQPSAVLVAEVDCLKGHPRDDLRWLAWAEGLHNTEYVAKEHVGGGCDLLCTAGKNHLKLWSFKRAGTKGSKTVTNGVLVGKACVIPQGKSKLAKSPPEWTATTLFPGTDGSADMIAGGSNGVVYLWRQGVCIASENAVKGEVKSLVIHGEYAFCGGMGGVLKVLDVRTLKVLTTFNLMMTSYVPSSLGAGGDDTEDAPVGVSYYGNDEEKNQYISGITVVSNSSASAQSMYVIACTSSGRCVRVNVGKALASSEGSGGNAITNMLTQFYFHVKTIEGLCTSNNASSSNSVIATAGLDKRICVWDINSKKLLARYIAKVAVRCCAFDFTNSYLAVGSVDIKDKDGKTSGMISLFSFNQSDSKDPKFQSEFLSILKELSVHKDAKEGFNDIKFSPDNTKLAAGSADNFIYIYNFDNQDGSLEKLRVLKGHSSFITHIDWSVDSLLIQSNCGAYELLTWEISKGKLYNAVDPADIAWSTHTCVLVFQTMGTWSPGSAGNDINAVDVSSELNLCITGDDLGKLNLMNYPCIVKNAPRVTKNASCAHVSNCKFVHRQPNWGAVTLGGRDTTMTVWKIAKSH